MTTMTIEMLPAKHGDALWVEWGTKPYRVIIDGGPGKSYPALRRRVESVGTAKPRVDMLTITHIDTDHIDGAVTLLLDDLDVEWGDIWFNGRNHHENPLSPVAGNRYLGGVQGQVLSAILAVDRFPWNEAFTGRAIVVNGETNDFPVVPIGGLTFTILSPGNDELTSLAGTWDEDVAAAIKNLELTPKDATETEVAKAIHNGGFDVARRLLAVPLLEAAQAAPRVGTVLRGTGVPRQDVQGKCGEHRLPRRGRAP